LDFFCNIKLQNSYKLPFQIRYAPYLSRTPIIHNFDIRRADGKTPAQRLFNREFPNLFEFVLDNMNELPKPRKRKMKNLMS